KSVPPLIGGGALAATSTGFGSVGITGSALVQPPAAATAPARANDDTNSPLANFRSISPPRRPLCKLGATLVRRLAGLGDAAPTCHPVAHWWRSDRIFINQNTPEWDPWVPLP